MFNKKKEEQLTGLQGISVEYPLDFFDKVGRLCDSFSKIYHGRESNIGNDYLDVIFDRCISFLIEIEQVKMMEYYKSVEPNWPEYLGGLKKKVQKKTKENK